MTEPWKIQLMGAFRVRQGARVITRFRTQKTGALLAFLACHRHHSHSREQLIEMFWPDTKPESGRHNLSHALSSLRSVLEPPGVPAGAVIIADRFSVELNPAAFTTDVSEFDEALRAATQARNTPDHMPLLRNALEKYRGALLPAYYDDWIALAQERLAQQFRQAATQLIGLLDKTGDLPSAVQIAYRVVELDLLNEEAQRELIRLLASTGQLESAVKQYRAFAHALDQDLGEEPSASLTQLFHQIEEQLAQSRPSLEFRVPSVTAPPTIAISSHTILPTGTVTLLCTAIEDFATHEQKAGNKFGATLSTHHAVLRHEFRRNGGHEVKEARGSFLVVFDSVGDALACAIACQRSLHKQPWPDEVGSLHVRMALHTGDVEQEDGEYHSLTLDLASQMLAASHGGQIVCSESTGSLLRRDLEPQVSLLDLGMWRLRVGEEPERLFQVVYPEIVNREFPPLNASPAHSAHLPLQFTRFFGREDEIARIVEALAQSDIRILTLSGPGGTGKTRLSIEGAAQFAEAFEGAIWFVPLADLSDPGLIPQAILQVMGVPLSGSKEPLEQSISALSKQSTLLILDNFEQLVGGGAELVQDLVRRVPALQCVVTSRQTLGLPGEVEFAVPPLSTPNGSDTPERLGIFESVRLFVDRAQAAKPDFRITNNNAPAVADICDRLEGIPLAIELAAARALVLSPAQMLAQLGNRFEFLVSRKRGVVERQRTLRATVDWSYRLLTPDVQHFFARLCVFRGGWTLEAAEGICEEPLALDMLAQLRECSLVTTQDSEIGIRFRMMETLREYAEEQISEEGHAAVRGRHAVFFAALAEDAEPRLNGPEQREWFHRLEAEHDNIRAALQWSSAPGGDLALGLRIACAIQQLWEIRGYMTEGRQWYARLLSADRDGQCLQLHSRSLVLAGKLAYRQSDLTSAQKHYQECLNVASAGDNGVILHALRGIGAILIDRGEVQSAKQYHEKALTICREMDDPLSTALVISSMGWVEVYEGNFSTAKVLFDDVMSYAVECGNHRMMAFALNQLGIVAFHLGAYSHAYTNYSESLTISRQLGDHRGIAVSLTAIGSALFEIGDYVAARTHHEECLNVSLLIGDKVALTHGLMGIAEVLSVTDRVLCAAIMWGAVSQQREELGTLLSPGERPSNEHLITVARTALNDDEAFDRAWQEGRAMTLEQAVAYALEADSE